MNFISDTTDYPSLYPVFENRFLTNTPATPAYVVICPKLPSKDDNTKRLGFSYIRIWQAWSFLSLPKEVLSVTLTTLPTIYEKTPPLSKPCYALIFNTGVGRFQASIHVEHCVEYGAGYVAILQNVLDNILTSLRTYLATRLSFASHFAYADGQDPHLYSYLAHLCYNLNFGIDIQLIKELAYHKKEQITPTILKSFLIENRPLMGLGNLTREQLLAIAFALYLQRNITTLAQLIDLLPQIHQLKQTHPTVQLHSFVALCLAEMECVA